MKHLFGQKAMAWFVIGLVALLLVPAVHAGESISVVPSSLNITGTAWTIESRTISVVANESVTGLQFTAFDLTAADGKGVIHQQFIRTDNFSKSMETGTVQQIPVTFNLGNVSSGSYSGEIWLKSSNASRVTVPVTMTLKDDLTKPLLILLFAVIASYSLFVYGSRFKASDEIRRTLGLLEERFKLDKDLETRYQYDREDPANPERGRRCTRFCDQIKSDIGNAEFYLGIFSVTDAENFMKNALKNWTSWTSQKFQLLPLFKKFEELITNLNKIEDRIYKETNGAITSAPIIVTLRQNLQKKFDGIIDEQGQQNLSEAITQNGEYYNDLAYIVPRIDGLQDCCREKNDEPYKSLKEKWTWKFLTEIPEQEIGTRKSDIEKIFREVLTDCEPATKSTEGRLPFFEFRKRPQGGTLIVNDPVLRLLLYDWGMFLVTVSVLAMAGFYQLYLSNPTFGSLSDYLTLALWGLMAGPSADAITTKTKTTIGIS